MRTGVDVDSQSRDHVLVEIADDGIGFGDRQTKGRGLDNMRRRAASIAAGLEIASTDQGSRVCIRLPLTQPHLH
ncbi:MAG: hypothetical protein HC808_08735 [Candidatus Competibacteraceae bacterium]|nr:hypothetical protein [Candidatus Competibacteraceae bacterium]